MDDLPENTERKEELQRQGKVIYLVIVAVLLALAVWSFF